MSRSQYRRNTDSTASKQNNVDPTSSLESVSVRRRSDMGEAGGELTGESVTSRLFERPCKRRSFEDVEDDLGRVLSGEESWR